MIAAFEARTSALRGKSIATTELVPLRLLLQVVLYYAKPVDGGKPSHWRTRQVMVGLAS